jgi:hypothetical protein
MRAQAYPCLCAYYAIFRLGRFSFYLLVPRHTSSFSLLANAMLMCRFAPPLAFNYMAGLALPPSKSYSPGRDVTETVPFPPPDCLGALCCTRMCPSASQDVTETVPAAFFHCMRHSAACKEKPLHNIWQCSRYAHTCRPQPCTQVSSAAHWQRSQSMHTPASPATGTQPEHMGPCAQVFYQEFGVLMMRQPLIGWDFTTYLPVALVPYMLLLAFNVFNRLAQLCMPARSSMEFEDDFAVDGMAARGTALLQRELENHNAGQPLGLTIAQQGGFGGLCPGKCCCAGCMTAFCRLRALTAWGCAGRQGGTRTAGGAWAAGRRAGSCGAGTRGAARLQQMRRWTAGSQQPMRVAGDACYPWLRSRQVSE